MKVATHQAKKKHVRAAMDLSVESLLGLLQLPEGVVLSGISYDASRYSVDLHLIDTLGELTPDEEYTLEGAYGKHIEWKHTQE